MARPLKDGVDFFSLDCQMDDEIKYIEAEFGLDGFATVIKLWQAIYGNKGYYMVFTRNVRLMFSQQIRKGIGFVDEVVARCMDYGVFDRQIYKKYGVLTSVGVQKRYAKMTERRNLLKIDGRYLLISAPENWVIDSNNSVNVDNNRENVSENTESKVKRKEIEIEKEIEKEVTTTTACAHEGEQETPEVVEKSKGVDNLPPSVSLVLKYFLSICADFDDILTPKKYDVFNEANKFCAYNAKRGWDCLPDWELAADLWVARLDDMSERKG